MKKRAAAAQAAETGQPCPDTALAKRCPRLVEHLADTRWDDGTAREPSTLTIFVESGLLKVALNDRAGARSLYVTGSDFTGVLDALERHLRDETGDWRAWKARKGGK